MAKIERRRTKRVGKSVRVSMYMVFIGLIVLVLVVYHIYGRIFVPNVLLDQEQVIFYIPSRSEYEDVVNRLDEQGIIENRKSFEWVAKQKEYKKYVKPGRYKIPNKVSNNELINMLRTGNQDPVMVVFNHVRTLDQVAGKVSRYLEGDSVEFAAFFANDSLALKYGFEPAIFTSMFIPNTYEFFWTTAPAEFVERMSKEYEKFWDGERDRQAKKIKLTREEVITLASIVDEETLYDDENEMIAGVYINRIKQGIPLQADPTLKFALADFTIKRILNEDKKIDSPYNTYKYKGLPPGPISLPSVSAIDGVLHYEKHHYIFFCAKADFSGHHVFARNLTQHNKNAREYQKALNRNRIYR